MNETLELCVPTELSLTDREILQLVRTALLMLVDAIERKLDIPRTSEIRKKLKDLEHNKL